MRTPCAIVRPIGLSAFPWRKIYCILAELTSPYVHDLYQSQSTPMSPRAYFAAASALAFGCNRTCQDLGSVGGICKPKPHGTEDSICCELLLCIPWQYYTAAGLIHPRVNPWYSAYDRRKKCTKPKNGRSLKRHARQEEIEVTLKEAGSRNARRDIKCRQDLSERSFAWSTRYGYKRARWRRLWRMEIHAFL